MQTVLIRFAVDLTFEKLSWAASMPNEKIVVLEEKYKDLGLKDLGASEISDRLNVISWRICGERIRPSGRQRCRARCAEISEAFKGVTRIHRFVSVKLPRYSWNSDWCPQE